MSIFATNLDTTIRNGGIPLADLLGRIDAAWAGFRLTDGERAELADLARSRARPEDSMSPLYDRVAELERKVAALEAASSPADPDAPAEEWPEYSQPQGAHDAYMAGDRVTWHGVRYECLSDGCVWSPADYPAAWREVAAETPDTDTGEA